MDLDQMTDRELAETLRDAERTNDVETQTFALNEIADRLSLPLDETEQGFTHAAAAKVDVWIAEALA